MFKLTSNFASLSIKSGFKPINFSAKQISPFSTTNYYLSEIKKSQKPKTKTTKTNAKTKKEKPKSQLQLKKEARPKKPASAYNLFIKDVFKTFPKEDTRPLGSKMQEISLKWSGLSDFEKEKYYESSSNLLKNYQNDLDQWKLKFPTKLTPYTKYVKEEFHKDGFVSSGLSDSSSRISQIAKNWNSLTPQEKAAYN